MAGGRDTAEGEAIKLTARIHQSLAWDRTRHVLRLRLRSTQGEHFAIAQLAFPDLDAPDALARPPNPDQAAR